MEVQKIAAFTCGEEGGNPAGIVLCDFLPGEKEMQRVAVDVGFSETAFAAPESDCWRVRYFAPGGEVPFCGHATIALGAALARRYGEGVYALKLNEAKISVESKTEGHILSAARQSPVTSSRPAPSELVRNAMTLFSLSQSSLDPRLPPGLANAGELHLVLPLATHMTLREMRYEFQEDRRFMLTDDLCTISLIYMANDQLVYARNPFASGDVYEDAATGAAAAALGGYPRDLAWPHKGHIEIRQGDEMGMPLRLYVDISDKPGPSIRVSGTVRFIA